jgi:CRP/FNR family transcriptional activator FtrB
LTSVNIGIPHPATIDAVHWRRRKELMDTAADVTDQNDRATERLLRGTALFANLAPAHISQLASLSQRQTVRRGGTICRHGEPMPAVVVLAYGSAMLALKRPDGGRRTVRFIDARECFGLATAVQGRTCPADVIALADSLVISVPVPPLLRLLVIDPGFARDLLRELSDNYLELLEELQANVQKNAVQRLASYLGSLAEPNGSPHTWVARLPVSKTILADRLGITKETMSRLLRELMAQGAIDVARREITILDRTRLASAGR